MADDLLAPVRPALRALAVTFIPETARADEEAWARLEAIVAGAIASRPAALRRQVIAFVRLLDLASMLHHGRRLASLDGEKRTRLVEAIGAGRWLLLRRGVSGLRTLVQMGWYGQPDVRCALGYRASPAGWDRGR